MQTPKVTIESIHPAVIDAMVMMDHAVARDQIEFKVRLEINTLLNLATYTFPS